MISSLSKRHVQIISSSQKMANLYKNNYLSNNIGQNKILENKLKVLHLASDSFQGGAETVFRNTIDITSKCNNLIIYTASCDKNIQNSTKHICLDDYQNYNKILGIIKYIFNIKNYFILLKSLEELKIDIVHTQNYLSRLSPSVLFALKKYKKKNPNVRLIYTQHGFGMCSNQCLYNYKKRKICELCLKSNKIKIAWYNCDRRGRIYSILKAIRTLFYQGIFLKEQNLFDKIIFVSNFQMQKHIQEGYDINKLQVIRNPMNYNFLETNVKLEDKQNLIVFFGRISEEKNILLLIYAFRQLLNEKRFKKYKLLIIGNGDKKEEYQNLSKKLFSDIDNVDYNKNYCEFLEHLSPCDLKNILKKCKISVLPSLLYESFGLSIIESIMFGIVPLMSEVGALSETQKNFGGLCFKLNDQDDLCITLKDVIDNYDTYFKNISIWQNNIFTKTNENTYLNSLLKIYYINV